jgi:hypothetical protein
MKSKIAILTTAAVLICSSCGEDEKERAYPLPADFCGISASEDSVSPLYPPGERVEVDPFHVQDSGFMSPITGCTIEVDGELALDVRMIPASSQGMGSSIADFIAYERISDLDIREADTVAGDEDFLVWPDYGALHINCSTSPGLDFTGMTLGIGLDWVDGNQDLSQELSEVMRLIMEEFITRLSPGTCEI